MYFLTLTYDDGSERTKRFFNLHEAKRDLNTVETGAINTGLRRAAIHHCPLTHTEIILSRCYDDWNHNER